jgi:hypothetical protein
MRHPSRRPRAIQERSAGSVGVAGVRRGMPFAGLRSTVTDRLSPAAPMIDDVFL